MVSLFAYILQGGLLMKRLNGTMLPKLCSGATKMYTGPPTAPRATSRKKKKLQGLRLGRQKMRKLWRAGRRSNEKGGNEQPRAIRARRVQLAVAVAVAVVVYAVAVAAVARLRLQLRFKRSQVDARSR